MRFLGGDHYFYFILLKSYTVIIRSTVTCNLFSPFPIVKHLLCFVFTSLLLQTVYYRPYLCIFEYISSFSQPGITRRRFLGKEAQLFAILLDVGKLMTEIAMPTHLPTYSVWACLVFMSSPALCITNLFNFSMHCTCLRSYCCSFLFWWFALTWL